MKTEWDSYLDRRLGHPAVRQAYEEQTKVLSIGMLLAKQRKRRHGAGRTRQEDRHGSPQLAAANADRKT